MREIKFRAWDKENNRFGAEEYEVIGNKFENPELLKDNEKQGH